MKQSITFVLWVVSLSCFSQYSEFTIHDNGLIYDPETMNKLGNIVDSLNLKFKKCEVYTDFYSLAQGRGTLVYMEGTNKEARKAIESNISLSDFLLRFPNVKVKKDLYIVRYEFTDYKDKAMLEYSALPNGYTNDCEIVVKDRKINRKEQGWILGESDDFKALFLHQLRSEVLPQKYGRLVQYVDCMVDTTTQIFFPEAEGKTFPVVDPASKGSTFITWAEKFPNRPKMPDYDENRSDEDWEKMYLAYEKSYRNWDSLRLIDLDRRMNTSGYWLDVLENAAEEALATGDSDEKLEFYVARYLDKRLALRLKRSHRVIGYCSQDQSPRYQAIGICQLAAETAQWDVFLRSHLDIMNDRFERQSDGSYAWAARNTYLRELEELGIDVTSLLLGTSLRVINSSPNHYYGSIGRVGRALADTQQKDELENQLYNIIIDEQLDVYNRLLMAYLFSNYIYNLDDQDMRQTKMVLLDGAVKTLPQYAQEVYNRGR